MLLVEWRALSSLYKREVLEPVLESGARDERSTIAQHSTTMRVQ